MAWPHLSLCDSCLWALCLLCCNVESCHYYNCKRLTNCRYTGFPSWSNKKLTFTYFFYDYVFCNIYDIDYLCWFFFLFCFHLHKVCIKFYWYTTSCHSCYSFETYCTRKIVFLPLWINFGPFHLGDHLQFPKHARVPLMHLQFYNVECASLS